MGFFDKLKSSASDFACAAIKYVDEKLTENERRAEEAKAERERIAAERKAAEEAEKAAKEAARQEEIAEMLKPTCENGDCLWYCDKFYFTCPKDCECERKLYTKKKWGFIESDSPYWPYMKRYEKEDSEVASDFLEEFLPQYCENDDWISNDDFCDNLLSSGGLSPDNDWHKLFLAIKDGDYCEDMNDKFNYLYRISYEHRGILNEPIFGMYSLYSRSLDDFKYTVKLFAVLRDSDWRAFYFPDFPDITEAELYDADGNLKEVGFGGPEEGFYGDNLYNMVASWEREGIWHKTQNELDELGIGNFNFDMDPEFLDESANCESIDDVFADVDLEDYSPQEYETETNYDKHQYQENTKANDYFKEWFDSTKESQDKARENSQTVQRCHKCKHYGKCHSYIANCGAFEPR